MDSIKSTAIDAKGKWLKDRPIAGRAVRWSEIPHPDAREQLVLKEWVSDFYCFSSMTSTRAPEDWIVTAWVSGSFQIV